MKKSVRNIVCICAGLLIPTLCCLYLILHKGEVVPSEDAQTGTEESEDPEHYYNPYTPAPEEEEEVRMTKEEADSLQNRLESSMLIVNEEIPLTPNERVYDEELNVPYWMQMLQTEQTDIQETIEHYAVDFLTENWEFEDGYKFIFSPYSQHGYSTVYTIEKELEVARVEYTDSETEETYTEVTYKVQRYTFLFIGISLEESTNDNIQIYVYRTDTEMPLVIKE